MFYVIWGFYLKAAAIKPKMQLYQNLSSTYVRFALEGCLSAQSQEMDNGLVT